ncbi:hypothetical protein CLOM_g1639 [Closterium sp. NIES-68]|nr:hypothetical protein CLOM_g1639 [Closterium sp. NIES-68]
MARVGQGLQEGGWGEAEGQGVGKGGRRSGMGRVGRGRDQRYRQRRLVGVEEVGEQAEEEEGGAEGEEGGVGRWHPSRV